MEDRQIPTNISNESREIRKIVHETALNAKKGHVPSAFSWVEIAVVLYFKGIMKFDAKNPQMEDRDRFILSKGHGCLTLYAVLSELGFFPTELLDDFGGKGAVLPGHPDTEIPGVETCTGSLGHGLGVGAGFAMSAKLKKMKWYTYVLLGDVECHEGSIWEAAMFASAHKVDNIISTIDYNGRQIDGDVDDVIPLGNIEDKWKAFGWETLSCDGNNQEEIIQALNNAKKMTGNGKPIMIIMKTEMGFGVDFMMGSHKWHGVAPNDEQLADALSQNPETIGDY